MPIALILQFILAIPSIIKAVIEIIAAIRAIRDKGAKDKAQAEFDDIKKSIFEKKRVGLQDRARLQDLRKRLKERRDS